MSYLDEQKAMRHFGLEMPIEEAIKNEHYRLSRLFSRMANDVYGKQKQDYPSNLLDVISAYFSDWKIGHSGYKEIEEWFYNSIEQNEKKG